VTNIGLLVRLTKREVKELLDRVKVFPGHRTKFQNMLALITQEYELGLDSKENENLYSVEESELAENDASDIDSEFVYRQFLEESEDFSIQVEDMGFTPAQTAPVFPPPVVENDQATKRLTDELVAARQQIAQLEARLETATESGREVPESERELSGIYTSSSFEEISEIEPDSLQRKPLAPFEPVSQNAPEVGLSMDSSKMRSTLHNLDLEEITRCLGHAIDRHIQFSIDIRSQGDLSLTIMPEFFDQSDDFELS
jgi:hypothetical protein